MAYISHKLCTPDMHGEEGKLTVHSASRYLHTSTHPPHSYHMCCIKHCFAMRAKVRELMLANT